MCDLPNGQIEYVSRMSQEAARERLLAIGLKDIAGNDSSYRGTWFGYDIPLTEQQRDDLKFQFPKHHSDMRGGVWIRLYETNILVDGDIIPYDPICGRWRVHGFRICSEDQEDYQRAMLHNLAETVRVAIIDEDSTGILNDGVAQ